MRESQTFDKHFGSSGKEELLISVPMTSIVNDVQRKNDRRKTITEIVT